MAEEKTNSPALSELLQVRRDKLKAFEDMGVAPFGHRFEVSHSSAQVKENFDELDFEVKGEDAPSVTVAGRLMAVRGHGKAAFAELMDLAGKIQIYFRKDVLGDDKYAQFKLLDIGDIIGLKGQAFKTKSGEITLRVMDFDLLSKSLRPLPEKYHGITDKEARYRQRYVDLIMNPEVRDTFIKRTRIVSAIREYLDNKDFLEVETPVMSNIAGGAAAKPFITFHNALNISLYLRIATELNLKRLVIGGLERVYEIGRIFRNEGIDNRHNPEFTSIEVYQAYADYTDLMEITKGIVCHAAEKVLGTTKINYQGVDIDLANIKTISMNDAVKEATGIDFMACETVEEARALADKAGIPYEQRHGKGGILNAAFEEKVEATLMQPTFITGHPTEISPLAKRNPENPEITDRFEFFIYGRELANGFTELNDPIDQLQRFVDQAAQREQGDDEAHMMDHDYVTAMEYGLPPTGGLGIGIDRLVMLLTDEPSIRDVLLFPHMRPETNAEENE
ncbi:MAG: lysine--tRNA ligase [Selenomonadaceae bacterium]|nr:lysine--tRNA ligase [Selenomonadaceae bacterium]